MTKNALRSDPPQPGRLTLVDRHGQRVTQPSEEDETSVEYQSHTDSPEEPAASGKVSQRHQGQLIALAAVSVGCAAAAVAAGSYALWLSRYKAAGETLESVHDLLETCRKRVTRMEEELAGLPNLS